jgi:hypothetical protein
MKYTNYDSARFAYIDESIADSKNNVLTLDKYTSNIEYHIDNFKFIMSEPVSIIKEIIPVLFEGSYKVQNLPLKEWYRPESTAKRLYDTHDLWYLIMLVNKCSSYLDYKYETINYIDPEQAYKITKLLNTNKMKIKKSIKNLDEHTIYQL